MIKIENLTKSYPSKMGPQYIFKNLNFDFENMPVGDIIRYICIASGKKYKVETNAVIIADPSIELDEMVTRFYPVSSTVFSSIAEGAPAGGGGDLVGGISDVGGGEDEVRACIRRRVEPARARPDHKAHAVRFLPVPLLPDDG